MARKLSLSLVLLSALAVGCKSDSDTADLKANAVCPISGQPADAAHYYEHEGTRIHTCCEKCIAKVEADPATAMAKAYGN